MRRFLSGAPVRDCRALLKHPEPLFSAYAHLPITLRRGLLAHLLIDEDKEQVGIVQTLGMASLFTLRADLESALALETDDDEVTETLRAWRRASIRALAQHVRDTQDISASRLTMDAPLRLVQQMVQHEAVHPFQDYRDDVNLRLGLGRRVFALFHKEIRREPECDVKDHPMFLSTVRPALAFVHGCLGHQSPRSLRDVLPLGADPQAATRERDPSHVSFYSISAHPLAHATGVGAHVLKRAVSAIREEWPSIRRVETLSPIPGFVPWLRGKGRAYLEDSGLSEEVQAALWAGDDVDKHNVRDQLLCLCAQYLFRQKRVRGHGALDSVAHFHVGNGAKPDDFVWGALADTEYGRRQSAGIMIRYLYQDGDEMGEQAACRERAEKYAATGEVDVASAALQRWLS